MTKEFLTEEMKEKWAPLLEDKDAGAPVRGHEKRNIITRLLENQQQWNSQNQAILAEAAPANFSNNLAAGSNVVGWDPVLIGMLRRAAPLMIAYDVCGVQPMTAPTGLVFAMKARKATDTSLNDNDEILFDEADSAFSGTGTHAGANPAVLNDASPGTYTTGTGMTTQNGESLGDGTVNWSQIGFTIERTSVTATTRGLKAEFTHELAQDLRAVHGLDAETELANILSTEILFETNRQIMRQLYSIAEIGAQSGTATAGIFDLDVDSNGRWSVEKFKGLMFQLEREANQIATRTRRGKGNIIICSQDVASALAMAGILDYAPAIDADLNVDAAQSTYVGTLNKRFKVFVDPYIVPSSGKEFATVGYKGSNQYDAGYFYCPYVPLEMYKAVDPARMQPVVAFKSRAGFTTNPYANSTGTAGAVVANANRYYRKIQITNIA